MKLRLLSSLRLTLGLAVSTLTSAGIIAAQDKPQVPDSRVVKKSIKAVGYEVGGGATKVIFVGTPAAPNASGEAKVEAKKGGTRIEVKVIGMPQPKTLGTEFLTYVLWSVTPDGSSTNLGEIPTDKNGEGKLNTRVQSQTFAMGVTAEPYFAVALPSEIVVLVNDTTKNTKGKIYPENSYKLMKRSQYAKLENPLALTLDLENVPLDIYEARNAVDIAKSRGAEKYAPEIFSKASSSLQMAENSLASKSDRGKIVTNARQTIQFAEDARALSAQRQEAERIQKEKEAAAAAAAATATAEAEEQAAADKEAQMRAEGAKAQAEAQAKQAAERPRTQAIVIDFVKALLLAFTTLFPVVNPIGCAPIFLALTRPYPQSAQRVLARKIAAYSFGLLTVSLLFGTMILGFFGISLAMMQIAGGLVVAGAGWKLLNLKDDDSTGRETPATLDDALGHAFFPLTLPITVGPGAISIAITLGADLKQQAGPGLVHGVTRVFVAGLIGMLLLCVLILVCYANANRIVRVLGKSGTSILTRLSAFILFAIGIQILWNGLGSGIPQILRTITTR